MKKLIDFETLKANCGHKTAFGDCYTSTFSGHVKICNKDTCPIWNSLPDARVVGSKTEHTTNDTGLIIKKVEGL